MKGFNDQLCMYAYVGTYSLTSIIYILQEEQFKSIVMLQNMATLEPIHFHCSTENIGIVQALKSLQLSIC